MVIYPFRCTACGHVAEELRRAGDTAPPEHCGQPMRRRYQVSRPITRPHGYHLHPGDKGYWDFGDANDPNVRPFTEGGDIFSAYHDAERDIANAANYDGDGAA